MVVRGGQASHARTQEHQVREDDISRGAARLVGGSAGWVAVLTE